MITTGDARNILFSACKGVGIKDMHTSWAIPEGKVDRERIVVITPPEQTPDTYWENCFVAVNLCVPDIKGEANLKRLDELERAAKARFKEWTYGTYDGSAYRYRYENIGREEDVNLGCHYIDIRVLFRVLNIKNN